MAAIGGLILVFFQLGFHLSHCTSQYGICDIPCCSVTPNCSAALEVVCQCEDAGPIVLSEGDFPPSVQSAYITASTQLTIRRHALYQLRHLWTLVIDLGGTGFLAVEGNGLTFQKTRDGLQLTLTNAAMVNLAISALGGFFSERTEIQIQHIKNLVMMPSSFSFAADGIGPFVSLEHVDELLLAPNALNATIREVKVYNAYMKECSHGSFGRQISELDLEYVKIDVMHGGCIDVPLAVKNQRKVSIQSCGIGIVKPRGISGNIDKLEMKDTFVNTTEKEGFIVQVSKLVIEKSKFGEIQTFGLTVSAKDTIKLDSVKISVLRKNALNRLQVHEVNNGASISKIRHALQINNMKIECPDDGSLAFAENTMLALYGNLNVPAPAATSCPVDNWLRGLVGKPDDSRLSANDRKVFNQLKRAWHCATVTTPATAEPDATNEATVTTPMTAEPDATNEATVTTPATGEPDATDETPTNGDPPPKPPSEETSGQNWLWPVICVVVVVTMVVLTYLALGPYRSVCKGRLYQLGQLVCPSHCQRQTATPQGRPSAQASGSDTSNLTREMSPLMDPSHSAPSESTQGTSF